MPPDIRAQIPSPAKAKATLPKPSVPAKAAAVRELFASYSQLARDLVDRVTGSVLLGGKLEVLGCDESLDAAHIARCAVTAGWLGANARQPLYLPLPRAGCVIALPLETSEATLLGAFCVQLATEAALPARAKRVRDIAGRLRPVLDCLHRELEALRPLRAKMQALTDRTAELEWLFNVTDKIKSAVGDAEVVQDLLTAATERLQSAYGVLIVPERKIHVECPREGGSALRQVAQVMQKHLPVWAQRQVKPLVLNGGGVSARAKCKILSVPVYREGGRVTGVLAFLNPLQAPDYSERHIYMARHLGRQTAGLVEAQFDLMTGLYTRDGLEKLYEGQYGDADASAGSVLYIDIDRMQVINELHGLELGNEVIVRIAEIIATPGMADDAIAARISGDRFAIALPASDTSRASEVAARLQAAVARLALGPTENPVEVSISCGIAALVHMPEGLARALAAAEIACKKAKERGRNRVELYACDDNSMMRYQGDAVAVGQLRAAIKDDRLSLFAQRIVPLQNRDLPGGYELLMRLRERDGRIVSPGPFVSAAQRYQLLPSIDRWAVKRALEVLAPYRHLLISRGISMSINVSGQSLGDEQFVEAFAAQLRAAHLPSGCVMIELTEQAAVTNLARASELMRRLGALGCRLALDDFGTGANSLVNLKSLQIARVKIDGSFVRDIATERRSRATVRAIVELAKGYGIETVAEYVETEAIAAEVQRLGVDYAQGYAFGEPEPLEALLAGLSHDESLRLHKLFLEQ